jgi:Flp pilus assembly protein TadB
MRKRDARNVLAVLFVIAGAIPIVVWLGSWLYHSMQAEHLVQIALIVIVLYLTWWIRKRLEKK